MAEGKDLVEPGMTEENLREAGIGEESLDRLRGLRDRYAEEQAAGLHDAPSSLAFLRWLVTSGRLAP